MGRGQTESSNCKSQRARFLFDFCRLLRLWNLCSSRAGVLQLQLSIGLRVPQANSSLNHRNMRSSPGPHHCNKHLPHQTTKSGHYRLSGCPLRPPPSFHDASATDHLSALHSLYHSQQKWMPAFSRAPLPRTRRERSPRQCKPAAPRLLDGMGSCMLIVRAPHSWPSACQHHQHEGSASFDNKPATPTSCSPIPPRGS